MARFLGVHRFESLCVSNLGQQLWAFILKSSKIRTSISGLLGQIQIFLSRPFEPQIRICSGLSRVDAAQGDANWLGALRAQRSPRQHPPHASKLQRSHQHSRTQHRTQQQHILMVPTLAQWSIISNHIVNCVLFLKSIPHLQQSTSLQGFPVKSPVSSAIQSVGFQ